MSLLSFLRIGLRPAILLKKRLWHTCFPVNFAKFLRTPFLKRISGGCFCITDLRIWKWFRNRNRERSKLWISFWSSMRLNLPFDMQKKNLFNLVVNSQFCYHSPSPAPTCLDALLKNIDYFSKKFSWKNPSSCLW